LLLVVRHTLSQAVFLFLLIAIFTGADISARRVGDLNLHAVLDEVQSKHLENSSRLRGYTFVLRRTEQQLDDKGRIKREQVKVYQVFPAPHGAVITVLLSENGKDLPHDRLAEEKARANKEWQKQRRAAANYPDREDRPVALSFFQTSEFSVTRAENHGGKEVLVLGFKPRGDFKPSNDSEKFMAKLEGEMWIDVAEKMMVKLEARLAKSHGFGGLPGFFSALKPGTSLVIENAPLTDGLWVTTRVTFAPSQTGRLFSKGRRDVQKQEMSQYRPFDTKADRLY
jgi:hypothetical protein